MTTYATPFSGSEINPPNINQPIQTIGNIVNLASGIQGITQAAQMNPIAVQEAQLKLQQEQAQTQSINQINTERKWQVNALQQGMLQMNADGTPNTGYSKNDLYKAGDPLLGQDGKPVVSGDGQAVTADAGGMVGKPKPGAQTFAQKVMTNMPQTGASFLQTLSDSTTKTNQANASALAMKSNQLKELGGVFAAANTPGASAMDIREAGQNWLTTQDPATQTALSSQIGPLTDQMEHQIGQAEKVAGSDPKTQEAARNAVVQSFVGRLNALSTTKEIQETQKGQILPQGTTAGIQVATGAAAPQNTIAVPATVPLTSLEEMTTDAAGNPFIVSKAKSGTILGVRPAGASGAPAPVAPTAPVAAPSASAAPGGGFVNRIGAQAQLNVASAAADDWKTTSDSASTAARDIGVLQNIKQLAPTAITGVSSDRRQYVAGLLGLMGIQSSGNEKTDTDLLQKNSNMLASAVGSTDMARSLAEGSNPNTHMTPQAIQHAADQVIAQRQTAVMKQQFLLPAQTNPTAYTQKLAQWNAVADPRLLQWQTMTPQERSLLIGSMSAKGQADFFKKGTAFEQLRKDNGLQ